LWIAVLRTSGALGFATAAHLWGIIERPERIDVIIHPRRRIRPSRDERLHRVVVPDDEITEIGGLPVTSRSWSILDYVGTLSVREGLRVVDRALQQRHLTIALIRGRLRDHPFRSGNVVLRRILSITQDGAASESERRLHEALRRARLTGWYANYELIVDGRLVAVLDIAFPQARLAIEVDGLAYHVDVDTFIRDRRRQNDLVGLGWTVLRFTWWDVTERPEHVVRVIRQHLREAAGDRGA
jgi:very-short-patch-repair endonuclease